MVTDDFPSSVEIVSVVPTGGGSDSNNAGTVFATWPSLASNAVVSVAITVQPLVAGSITNSATVSAAVTDPVSANNSATVVTTVNPTADLAVSQTDSPDPVFAGNNLTYTIFVTKDRKSAG